MQWLLGECSIQEFRARYYERAPLHVRRGVCGYYDSAFSLAELERVLYSGVLRKSDLRVVRDGLPVRADSYLVPKPATKENSRDPFTDRIDGDRVSALFAGGCSVVMHDVPQLSPPLAALCRKLEMLLRHPVNANVYFTPPGNQGFAVHYDTHDTAILQIQGSKHWRVYESAFPLPLDDQEFDKRLHTVGAVLLEADLQPGDFLYIPRGFLHEAKSNEDLSLHATLGLYPRRWIQVLKSALDYAADDAGNEVLRETAEPESAPALRRILALVLSDAALERAEAKMRTQFARERRNGLDGQMAQIAKLPGLNEDSYVCARRDMLYELTVSEKAAALTFSGKTLVFGPGAAGVIRDLTAGNPIQIAALKKHDEKAPAIVRKLIAEGFAQQVDAPARSTSGNAVA